MVPKMATEVAVGEFNDRTWILFFNTTLCKEKKVAKMMMGQIDHARDRIRSIKAEKLGPSPKQPEVIEVVGLRVGLKDGSIVPTGPQLRRALSNFVDGIISVRATSNSVYSTRNRAYSNNYAVKDRAPENLEDALIDVLFESSISADVKVWQDATAEYQRLSKILNDRAAIVEDAIVLGDNSAALLALQEFAAFDPAAELDTL